MSRSKVFAELASQDVSKTEFDTLQTGIPTAGLADDAVTLAKMAPGDDGSIITYDALDVGVQSTLSAYVFHVVRRRSGGVSAS